MFKKISTILVATVLSTAASGGPKPASKPTVKITEDVSAEEATLVCSKGEGGKLLCKPLENGEIELNTTNTITLNGPITSQSASKFIQAFHDLEYRDEVQRIYIFIRSPGGSIFAGDYIANAIASSKKEVVVIIDFAASMAFHISQHATKRLILPTGTMMQHHASGGPNPGEFPNVDSEWNWLKKKVSMMNKKDSTACSKTTHANFMKNIDRDWWVLSDEAVATGCADAIATRVKCTKDLSNKIVTETVNLFGMSIKVGWSGCPLEAYPRSIDADNLTSGGFGGASNLTPEQAEVLENYIMLVTDPLQFYNSRGSFRLELSPGRKGKPTPSLIR
jgi:ATP-dependent protease ClpP protease subunit